MINSQYAYNTYLGGEADNVAEELVHHWDIVIDLHAAVAQLALHLKHVLCLKAHPILFRSYSCAKSMKNMNLCQRYRVRLNRIECFIVIDRCAFLDIHHDIEVYECKVSKESFKIPAKRTCTACNQFLKSREMKNQFKKSIQSVMIHDQERN